MVVSLSGVEGAVRWGYHSAAILGAWSISRTETAAVVLTATVAQADAFRLSQRPIVFVAHHAKGTWRWPIASLQVTGASLTAVLGQRES